MRGIVEVPLNTLNGTKVGKVLIDKKGRVKIEMKGWARPSDLGPMLAFLHTLANALPD